MIDDTLKRKMAQEFAAIEQTSFWHEYLKKIDGLEKYNISTLKASKDVWELAKSQGEIFAYKKVSNIPGELTGIGKSPQDKE